MARLARYPTSFVATICHTISGLSVIAAVLWIVPAVTFFLPSVVTGFGDAIGIDLTEFVFAVESSPAISAATLVGSFVTFAVSYFVFKLAGDKLYAVGKPTAGERSATQPTAGQQPAARTKDTGAPADSAPGGSTDYVRSFSNLSFFLGGVIGLLFFVVLFNPGLIPPELFGVGQGQFLQMIFGLAAVYLLAGYGARKGAIEAVIVGTGVFGIRFLMGLAVLNVTGLIIGGMGMYYGIRSLLSGRLEWLVLSTLKARRETGPGGRSGHQQRQPGGQTRQAQHGQQPRRGQPRGGQGRRGQSQARPPQPDQTQTTPSGREGPGSQQRSYPGGQRTAGPRHESAGTTETEDPVEGTTTEETDPDESESSTDGREGSGTDSPAQDRDQSP